MTEKRQYQVPGATIYAFTSGPEKAPVTLVLGHGWNHSHSAFDPLMENFRKQYAILAFDFPGFGASPPPNDIWGTAEYADAAEKILKSIPGRKIWIGHSFGSRVGLQLASRHPKAIDGLFLIAAAGLKRKRPLLKRIYLTLRIRLFKSLKKYLPQRHHVRLYELFGSTDYKSAGAIRAIFVKVVNEDLSEVAAKITCPVRLVYGDKDTETPPEIGKRLAAIIPGSTLSVLSGQDHYTLLGPGKHQVASKLMHFIDEIKRI